MNQMTDELALHKSIVVACPVEHAFRVFTERMNDWWPFEGHSIFDGDATIVWEPRVGGRVYERSQDGEEGMWGTVVAWDPPRSFAMTWHPGRDEETAQDLSVTFSDAPNGTRVDLVHTGWERLGGRMAEVGGRYDQGWELVLGRFTEAAAREG
jgi:Activator of Hsp90 ATPase homolog 1-like protein